MTLSILTSIFVNGLPILIAIICHEIAHGYAAYLLGDDTAKRYGRLSLNPLRHIDAFGTVILPLILYFSQIGFIFGWAKPVPIDFYELKNRRLGTVLVAAAGIVVNILLAVFSAVALKAAPLITTPCLQTLFVSFFTNMVAFNIILALFNAIPIPPLDGSKILFGWMKNPLAVKYVNAERYGLWIIILLVFILPVIGHRLGYELNFFSRGLINAIYYFNNLLM